MFLSVFSEPFIISCIFYTPQDYRNRPWRFLYCQPSTNARAYSVRTQLEKRPVFTVNVLKYNSDALVKYRLGIRGLWGTKNHSNVSWCLYKFGWKRVCRSTVYTRVTYVLPEVGPAREETRGNKRVQRELWKFNYKFALYCPPLMRRRAEQTDTHSSG